MDLTGKVPLAKCPPILALARWLGDNRLLTEGGVLQQPAGAWRACQYARYLDDLLDRMGTDNFKARDEREIKVIEQINVTRADHPEWGA